MSRIAAIYIRVSTDAQREEGYSIDAQKEMLTAYCVSKSIKEYDYYIDGGYTGSNLDRPELQRLIKDVLSDRIGCVLVYKLDRLSRSQKDTLYLIEDIFNPHNVDFVSLNESMDTSTPLGRLMLGILSAFAQLERENIRERTRMGMKERVKSGLWMGGGKIPFGYDYDSARGILVPNSDADTVRKAYDLYLKGYSTNSIARILGLKYEKLVRQILTRKSNAGYITYNGEEYIGKHEPIVSVETYEEAMRAMSERAGARVRNEGHLLTGLMRCGYCGAKMRYQKWGKSGYKIVCYSRDKSKPHLVKDPECPNCGIWAEELEEAVKEDLFSLALKENDKKNRDKGFADVLEALTEREKKVNEKLKKLYLMYSDADDDALKEAICELKKELDKIRKQIKSEKDRQIISNKMKDVKKELSTLRETWEYMTKVEQRNIVRSCISEIVISNGDVKIYYSLVLFRQ